MGIDIVNLLNYLRLEGPYDEDLIPLASDEDAPSPGDESANEGQTVDTGEVSKKEPMEEKDLEEEHMEEKNPEEGLSKGEEELIDEADPKEDLEEDPEEHP